MPRHGTAPIIAIGVLCAATLVGCARSYVATGAKSSPTAGTTEMPDDWRLDATVLAGSDASERAPAHLRPSRYTVFPDGSLAVAAGWESPLTLGQGEANETTLPSSQGAQDPLVARYNADGSFAWAGWFQAPAWTSAALSRSHSGCVPTT